MFSESITVMQYVSLAVVTLGLATIAAQASFAQNPKLTLDSALLSRGDHTDHEILQYRRIRVQRQEVILDDSDPVIGAQNKTVLLAGRNGSLARSLDGGQTWESLDTMVNRGAPPGAVLALSAGPNSTFLAAVQSEGKLCVVSSHDRGQTWNSIGEILTQAHENNQSARLIVMADRAVMLSMGRRIYRSTNGGAQWSKLAELPQRWAALHPVVVRSGKLMAAVRIQGPWQEGDSLSARDGEQTYRNTFLTESTDGGKTWSPPRGVTRMGQVPADLVELRDGRLVLAYGEESFPYGARALVSSDGGQTWGREIYVLGLARYAPKRKARPTMCQPSSGVASTALPDGVIVSAFDRDKTIRPSDENGTKPAIAVVCWKPEGFKAPPLAYPNLWTQKVDAHGYLDNGLVRMRPDDRYEGGDYVENYEMVVYQRLPGESFHFPTIGNKGIVLCRHPDGSLVFSSREPVIHRSTDEGRTWTKIASVNLQDGAHTFGFGVTRKGTFLVSYQTALADEGLGTKAHIARSVDEGRSWNTIDVEPGPMKYAGRGDGSRITELSDGTVIMTCGNAWMHPNFGSSYEGDVIIRSRDDGQTWGDCTVLPPGSCESNLLEIPGGQIICATRLQRAAMRMDFFDKPGGAKTWPAPSDHAVKPGRFKNEAVMFSSDAGYNWTTPQLITRLHMVSGDIVQLSNNRLVVSYSHKDAVGGARARVSNDRGKTWEPNNYILHYAPGDTRTSSVVLKDGRILTMYAGDLRPGESGVRAMIWSPL